MEYYIDPVVFIVGKTGGENRAVRNLLDLFAEGATIPFIARYRKEKTGNMDEVRIGGNQNFIYSVSGTRKKEKCCFRYDPGTGKIDSRFRKTDPGMSGYPDIGRYLSTL